MAYNNFVFAISLIASTILLTVEAHTSPQEYVEAHNKIRAEVGVGPLSWNDTLAELAEDFLAQRIDSCEFDHSYSGYGQCLAQGYNMTGLDAVRLWYDERVHYDGKRPISETDECLHYTQLVWRDTTQIGCAISTCKSGVNYVDCNYYPCGNVVGQMPY